MVSGGLPGPTHGCRRGVRAMQPGSEGPVIALCSAVLGFLVISEQGALQFHFVLGTMNYAAGSVHTH